MIEKFMVTKCFQLDVVSQVEQDSEWMDANGSKIELLLHAKGYCSSDIVSTETSEDRKTTSLFLFEDVTYLTDKDFRGYVMSVGDLVRLEGVDEEPLEILKVVHQDDSIEYYIKFMFVSGKTTEEF